MHVFQLRLRLQNSQRLYFILLQINRNLEENQEVKGLGCEIAPQRLEVYKLYLYKLYIYNCILFKIILITYWQSVKKSQQKSDLVLFQKPSSSILKTNILNTNKAVTVDDRKGTYNSF